MSRILVIDDEDVIRMLVVEILESAGHAVVPASSAEAALSLVDDGDFAKLSVRDTGVGMEPKTLDRIFEPFFTTKADGKGTGLGLPIVRNIVDQHRGQISVSRSDLGGAAFRVVIPIV